MTTDAPTRYIQPDNRLRVTSNSSTGTSTARTSLSDGRARETVHSAYGSVLSIHEEDECKSPPPAETPRVERLSLTLQIATLTFLVPRLQTIRLKKTATPSAWAVGASRIGSVDRPASLHRRVPFRLSQPYPSASSRPVGARRRPRPTLPLAPRAPRPTPRRYPRHGCPYRRLTTRTRLRSLRAGFGAEAARLARRRRSPSRRKLRRSAGASKLSAACTWCAEPSSHLFPPVLL